jgi:CIC family chloride channel protein
MAGSNLPVDPNDARREFLILGMLATVIGALGGLVAIGFKLLVEGMWEHVFLELGDRMSSLGAARYVLIPALGGLIVGPMIYLLAREAKGHGVPEVLISIARFGGRMRARLIAVKAIASAITIGTGGSAGREGPIVQIGSALGSNLAQRLGLTRSQTKILLGCGAAAAISSTFNTPIAGALFALELVLMEFKTRSFVPIVIASVFGNGVNNAVSRLLWDAGVTQVGEPGYPAFRVKTYQFVGLQELPFYLLLGLICGLVALVYIYVLYWTEDAFERTRFRPWILPAIGGLAVGVLGIAFPMVYGIGYDHMEAVLNNEWVVDSRVIVLMGVLAFVKVAGVSLTIGSGGSGGIFAPALFIGCMVGGCYGAVVHDLLPDITANYGAYAVVGMGALMAASTRGTLTSIVIIFEMTRAYEIILPLLFACVIADLVGAVGSPDTIYTKALSRRGILLVHDLEPNVMQLFSVREVMVPKDKIIKLDQNDDAQELVRAIVTTNHMGFPVLDEGGGLVGVVTQQDMTRIRSRKHGATKVSDIMSTDLRTVVPDNTGEEALRAMGSREVSHLPVVEPGDPTRLVGWLSKGDLVFAYERYRAQMEAPLPRGPDKYETVKQAVKEGRAPRFRRLLDRKGRKGTK